MYNLNIYVRGDEKMVVGSAQHKVEDPPIPGKLWSNYFFLLGDNFLLRTHLIWKIIDNIRAEHTN